MASLTFHYVARTATGRTTRGEIVAMDRTAALRTLIERRGLAPISCDPARSLGGSVEAVVGRLTWWLHGLSLPKWRLTFFKQMAMYARNAVAIDRAIALAMASCKNQRLRDTLRAMLQDMTDGVRSSLSENLAAHPSEFSEVHVAIVKSAEGAVGFPLALERLAYLETRRWQVQNKVIRALFYPMLVVLGVVGLLVFVGTVFVPSFAQISSQFNRPLPPHLVVMAEVGGFLGSPAGVTMMVLAMGGLWFAGRLALASPSVRLWLDEASFKVPVFGDLRRKSITSTFGRFFAAMYTAAVPLRQAFELVAAATASPVYRRTFAGLAARIGSSGASEGLAPLLAATGRFDAAFVAIVSAGEESQSPAEAMLNASNEMDAEVEGLLDSLLTLLEPMLVALLGGAVAVVLGTVYGAIYSLQSSIR